MGPLFYILFTNDLPEVVYEEDCELSMLKIGRFNTACPHCGSLVSFADDSTFTMTGCNPNKLAEKLSEEYLAVSKYFAAGQ